jgi:hypothetical protein
LGSQVSILRPGNSPFSDLAEQETDGETRPGGLGLSDLRSENSNRGTRLFILKTEVANASNIRI